MSRRRVEEGIDRLSDLPDGIRHHILSFLDTKAVVQTSILSSRWRSLWKGVPVLNFRRSSFASDQGFVEHVVQVLSLRRSDCGVLKVSTDFRVLTHMNVFDRIIGYAASHGVEQLELLRIVEEEHYSVFPNAIDSVLGCCGSLKVLELQQAYLDRAAFKVLSRLELLETLTLHSSYFNFGRVGEPFDPFPSFPKLECLKLLHCTSRGISYNPGDPPCCLKVSGPPQLLYLEIHEPSFDDIEISVPNLKSFTFWADVGIHTLPKGVVNWSFPSLEHADLSLWVYGGLVSRAYAHDDYKRSLLARCADLFYAVRDVESLSLHLETTEMLVQAGELVKDQPLPFKRMKSFSLLYAKKSSSIPYQVIRYFLEGSPNVEKKRVMIEKRPRPQKHELVRGSSVLVVYFSDSDLVGAGMEEAEVTSSDLAGAGMEEAEDWNPEGYFFNDDLAS